MNIGFGQTPESFQELFGDYRGKSLGKSHVFYKFGGNTSANDGCSAAIGLKAAFADHFIFHFDHHFHGISARSCHFGIPIWIFDPSKVPRVLPVINDNLRILLSNLFHNLLLKLTGEFFEFLISFHFPFHNLILNSGNNPERLVNFAKVFLSPLWSCRHNQNGDNRARQKQIGSFHCSWPSFENKEISLCHILLISSETEFSENSVTGIP